MSTQKTSTAGYNETPTGTEPGRKTDDPKRKPEPVSAPDTEDTDTSVEEIESNDPTGEGHVNDPDRLDRTRKPEEDNDPTRIRKDGNNPEKVDPTRIKK